MRVHTGTARLGDAALTGLLDARGLALDAESTEAVRAAGAVVDLVAPEERARTAVVWATSTAGGPDYDQVCCDTATLGPGRASAYAGPRSAYNGPASAVSIAFGLTGPLHTVLPDAGHRVPAGAPDDERVVPPSARRLAEQLLGLGTVAAVVLGTSSGPADARTPAPVRATAVLLRRADDLTPTPVDPVEVLA